MAEENKTEMPDVMSENAQEMPAAPEQTTQPQELKPETSGSKGSQMMVALIILIVLALLGGLGYYLYSQSQGTEELDTDEKLEAFSERSAKAVAEFDGVMTSVVRDSSTGEEASVEFDFESGVARFGDAMVAQLFGQTNSDVEEVLLSDGGATIYMYDGEEWYSFTQETDIAPLSVAETLEEQVSFDLSYTEYVGIEDCPESSGSCYHLIITREVESDVYFDVDTALPVYADVGGVSVITYEYDNGASIKEPEATELTEDDPFFLELFGGASGIQEEGSSDDFEDDFDSSIDGLGGFSDEELDNLSDEELQDLLEQYLQEGL